MERSLRAPSGFFETMPAGKTGVSGMNTPRASPVELLALGFCRANSALSRI
jgi:hypothetical protein